MPIESDWLKPTGLTRGQDHLAIRAICEILYGKLLPGVTNVTDRARYYSLYTWVLWAMDEARIAREDRRARLRRADCLLTLISLHQGTTENTRAAVGSSTLSKVLDGDRAGQRHLGQGRPVARRGAGMDPAHPARPGGPRGTPRATQEAETR